MSKRVDRKQSKIFRSSPVLTFAPAPVSLVKEIYLSEHNLSKFASSINEISYV